MLARCDRLIAFRTIGWTFEQFIYGLRLKYWIELEYKLGVCLRGFGSLFASRFRKVIFLVVVLLVALTVGVYAYMISLSPHAGPRVSVVSPPLEFSIGLEKTEFQQAEPINMTVSLKNVGNEMIQLMWTSYYLYYDQRMYFDFVIVDENDTLVYQWTGEHLAFAAVLTETLNPGEQLVSVYPWYQLYGYEGGEGTYYVKGLTRSVHLTVNDQTSTILLETPSITIIIN